MRYVDLKPGDLLVTSTGRFYDPSQIVHIAKMVISVEITNRVKAAPQQGLEVFLVEITFMNLLGNVVGAAFSRRYSHCDTLKCVTEVLRYE